MECLQSDSKKMFKVFDASRRKRQRKKRDGIDDTNSLVTDESASCRASSAKASLQNVKVSGSPESPGEERRREERDVSGKQDMDSSPSVSHSHGHICRSPRRYRRPAREGISLALKAGMVSTPRSASPTHNCETAVDRMPREQDSYIYTFLEEAVKREKKKQRQHRHYEECHDSRERESSLHRERRHHHRRKRDGAGGAGGAGGKHDRAQKDGNTIDAEAVIETFAKLCSHLTEKSGDTIKQLPRTQSHKSLQCQVVSKRDFYDVNQRPVKLRSNYNSQNNIVTPKVRSQEHIITKDVHHQDGYTECDIYTDRYSKTDKYSRDYTHEKDDPIRYSSKRDSARSRLDVSDRYREHNVDPMPNRSRIVCRDHECYREDVDQKYVRDYDKDRQHDKKRQCEQKTHRSYDTPHDRYVYDNVRDNRMCCRRVVRSEVSRDKGNDLRAEDAREEVQYGPREVRDKLYDDRDKCYEERGRVPRTRHYVNSLQKDHMSRRNLDSRCDRNSVVSRDDDYKERDRFSERERDSGLSVADGDTSVISTRSNYLRAVKQEISEQREAMDKMMQLWKELMKCFKGMSQNEKQCDKNVQETATNARNSAVEQLRLWRECMRRYETVARDVGDTDARLMEEINKQRSEMAEMATMWQECLQRYRDMSNDFNNLKQQLAIGESPSRIPAAPLICAEGEGLPASAPGYRIPPSYVQAPPQPSPAYAAAASPLRSRASVPPTWWWYEQERQRERERARLVSPRRRRSSPESRGSRDRDKRNRHKERDRDNSRYKEKPSKQSVTRSEHRHKKR